MKGIIWLRVTQVSIVTEKQDSIVTVDGVSTFTDFDISTVASWFCGCF